MHKCFVVLRERRRKSQQVLPLAQLRNIGYNGTPHIHPQNCPFPFDDHHPHLIPGSSTDPTHHFIRHPDPFSRFATVNFPDMLTDMHTDLQMR